MRILRAILAGLILISSAMPLNAQQVEGESLMEILARATDLDEEEQRGGFVAFVENQISTPDRQVRLTNIEGALSSQAAIGQITISDTQGIYLIVENAQINWNQAALLLGRLEIRSLSADSITYLRNPIVTEAPAGPAPEAGGFAVPELPVAVILENLSVPSIAFGEQVFGLGSEIALEGSMILDDGAIDTNLEIERLDGPGGALTLALAYSNETREIDLDLSLVEPEDGIVANLLGIEGRPEIELGLAGEGVIDDLDVSLFLNADGQRILTGSGSVDQALEGLSIDAELGGPVADLLPLAYHEFFGANTAIALNLLLRDDGGLTLSRFQLSGGALSLLANADTTADGFLNRLEFSGEIASADGSPVILPVPGAATTVERARFTAELGANGSQEWDGGIEIIGFATPDFGARSLVLDASGIAENLEDPQARRLTFNADGLLDGISATSHDIAQALGSSIGLGIAGLWEAGEPVQLAQFRLLGEALSLDIAGQIEEAVFDGTIALQTASLAPFSGLAGRDLSGALQLVATGTVSPLNGGFDLLLDGTGDNLAIDEPMADRLLEGPAQLSGRVARTEAGLETEGFVLTNPQVEITADGIYASQSADFSFNVALADLGIIDPQMSGELTASGTAQGEDGTLGLQAEFSVPQAQLGSRNLRDANVNFTGISTDEGLAGAVSGAGFLDGFRIALGTDIDVNSERTRLENLVFDAPGASLNGALTLYGDGTLDGRLALDAPNIEAAAGLVLIEARGAVQADIALAAREGEQDAVIDASLNNVRIEDFTIGSASVDARIADLFGVPVIEGDIEGSAITAGGVGIDTLSLAARTSEDITNFEASAALGTGANISLAGALSPINGGFRVGLDRFAIAQDQISANLARPAQLIVAGERVQFSGVELAVGTGRVTATGSAGENLDIALTIDALPLSIANVFAPDLALSGTINATATVAGSASSPEASFSLQGSGLSAAAIAEYGIGPLSVQAQGRYANETIVVSSAQVTAPQGLNATLQGSVPLAGSGLNLSVNGSAPLALANPFIADRGATITGTASFNAQVTGSLDDPQLGGTVSVANGDYIDPPLALRLQQITGTATLSGQTLTINQLSANLATGGSVSATGTVGLDAPNFTSNVTVSLNNARYADGNLLVATLNGAITLSGPLGRGGLVSGTIDVARADITVPDTIGGPGGVIDVDHRYPPAEVAATLARARIDQRAATSAAGAGPALALDLTINAPNQIFLRGRGLDAEVGGNVRLTGTIDDLMPVGGFELIRGRLSILGQRIDFDSGRVTLIGDLDPYIDLVARTEGTDITVFVIVSGRASAPQIEFSSEPMLPQDEVLSRLIFNRGVGELGPLQLAQLAAAAAEMAGGGSNPGLLDSLRAATGLDDLDIVTDAEGNAALRAGRYIDENIYLGVETGSGGESRVTIDLDITENLRARGATGTDGDSSIGIFFEYDY